MLLHCTVALGLLTAKPLGVVLVAPHGVPLSQAPEDGGVGAHEVDVHAGEEFLVCGKKHKV